MIAGIALLALALGAQAAPSVHASPVSKAQRATARAPAFDAIAAAAMEAWNAKSDQKAIDLFRKGLQLHPGWTDALWYLGAIFYEREDYREARDYLRHYLARNPQNGAGWALVGMSDYKLREYVHASEDLRRALAAGLQGHDELAGPVYYYSALLLTHEERFTDSAALLYKLRRGENERIHLNAPLELPLGLNALGYALLPEETPADRIELARQTGVAVFARFEQQRNEAKSILLELLKQYPNEEGLHYQYGVILLEDHAAEGVGEMQKAMELSPSNPEPHLSLAGYYYDLGKNDEALAQINKSLILDATLVSSYLKKGQILRALGDISGAVTQFETARKLSATDTRVLWELMRAYHKAGREEDAEQVMKELEKLNAKPVSEQ